MKIRVGIIGAAGYTGGELIRLLLNHPNAEIKFANSNSCNGKKINSIHQDLVGECELVFTNKISNEIDVLFLCANHGESRKFLTKNKISEKIKIIDLSHDFRLIESSKFGNRKFIYGLPELNRDKIIGAQSIANPGCFATAIELGLLPLAKKKLLNNIYTTGITGSTGAGQSPTLTSHFSWRENNIQAYKVLTHQHIFEINETLFSLQKKNFNLNFVPWRGNFTRGIFVSSQLKCRFELKEVLKIYSDFYFDSKTVFISEESIYLKQVVNTNKCLIQIEKIGDNLVVHSVIDNLLKGASGQAIQNMNLIFGLNETVGLKLKPSSF